VGWNKSRWLAFFVFYLPIVKRRLYTVPPIWMGAQRGWKEAIRRGGEDCMKMRTDHQRSLGYCTQQLMSTHTHSAKEKQKRFLGEVEDKEGGMRKYTLCVCSTTTTNIKQNGRENSLETIWAKSDPGTRSKEATFFSSSSSLRLLYIFFFFFLVAVKKKKRKAKTKHFLLRLLLSFSTRAAAHGDYYSWPCFVSSTGNLPSLSLVRGVIDSL